jgi:hypothetical protein
MLGHSPKEAAPMRSNASVDTLDRRSFEAGPGLEYETEESPSFFGRILQTVGDVFMHPSKVAHDVNSIADDYFPSLPHWAVYAIASGLVLLVLVLMWRGVEYLIGLFK